MQAAARQMRRCAREDEQNGSQGDAPVHPPQTMGKPRRMGSDSAGAAMHAQRHIPMLCCMRSNNCLRRYLRKNRRPGPNRPPPSVFVGGYDDGKHHDAARLPMMARRCGRLGVERPRCLSEMRYHEGRLWQEDPSLRDKKTEPDSNLRSIRFWMLHKLAAHRAQIPAATPRIRPDRRIRAAWHISFFSPKNPIRDLQAGLLTQNQRPHVFSAYANDILWKAPLHSSGPVGEFHSVPFSPVQDRHLQTPMYSVFKGIITRFFTNVNPLFGWIDAFCIQSGAGAFSTVKDSFPAAFSACTDTLYAPARTAGSAKLALSTRSPR